MMDGKPPRDERQVGDGAAGQTSRECLSCATADHAARGCNFAAEIMGNRVANFAVVELGFGRLQVALAERDGEQAFPTCIILAVEKWR
jgi:hypothetical protein